ncbi:lycopene cyclase family protein [Flavisericum labens]|uniref:lycopene cyclase family protein n=1 Tax=Flavisericum labens TaxID=3377112 RepID=UPI00387B5728
MEQSVHFDYIIIGNGLAGLQLALRMEEDNFFSDKKIALIDPSKKNSNDKTWSFWETEPSRWNSLVYKSWEETSIITSKEYIPFNLYPYSYKTIRSIDFYTEAKNRLKNSNNFQFIKQSVLSIDQTNTLLVKTENNSYSASHVFDSRIPSDFSKNSKNHISLIQHFKGWMIKTEKETFNDSQFTMMDYRLKDSNQCTFMYVLPFSKNEALIEFTYFTEHVVQEKTYNEFIETYIKDYLKIDNYSIIETEMGQIPMTTFPFHKFNTNKITKIGTAGGWVKGSTGYSFKNTEKKTVKIIENLKDNQLPSKGLFKKRFRFYDKVFLKVLKDENYKGEWIFSQFYKKNNPVTIFRFLDEESTFIEELKVMNSLFSWSFIKAFFKTL